MSRMDFRSDTLLSKQANAVLLAAAAVGVLLIVVGAMVQTENSLLSILPIAVGGSMTGTCFGFLLGDLTEASSVHKIREIVERSQSLVLKSSEEDLEPFRKMWHRYFVSDIDGTYRWVYRSLDFSQIVAEGRLYAKVSIADPGDRNKTLEYVAEGYVLGDRLIVVFRSPESTESPGIHIYPKATEGFRSEHAGLAVYQSWNGTQLTTPVLLAAKPIRLSGKRVEGPVSIDRNSELNDRWDEASRAVGLAMVRGASAVPSSKP